MIALLISLVLTLTNDGLQITVSSDMPAHVYIQADNANPAIRLCDLHTGEACGLTVRGMGAVRVRAWTDASGQDADADQYIVLPAPYRTYLPL